jgi:uncharacterized protein YjbI with pentapeptide repeats
MATKRHLARLKQGVEAWNAWREKNPGIQPDLCEADLARTNLTAADVTEANLAGALLTRATLVEVNLSRATLAGATLTEALLTGANLFMADLVQRFSPARTSTG